MRKYKEEPVPDMVVHDALECARQAPTARNVQPWLIGVIRDPATLGKIAELADHGPFIAGAPICFAVFAEKDHTYYLEDGCAATEQLMLGLWAHGVGSCWVAGDKKEYAEAVRLLLGVPGAYTLVSLIPAGYPADMTLPPKKALDEIVFTERWEETP